MSSTKLSTLYRTWHSRPEHIFWHWFLVGVAGTLTVVFLIPPPPEVGLNSFLFFTRAQVSGLEVAFSFDEGSGTIASDASGNGHTGTLMSSPTWTAGRYDQALQFDGNRSGYQYVSFGPDDSLDSLSGGTIMAWVKLATASGPFMAWFQSGKDGDCSYPIELATQGSNIKFWGGTGGGCSSTLEFTSPIPGTVTDWHHMTYVVDSSGHTFYIDGSPVSPNYTKGNASSKVFFSQTSQGTSKYRVGATEWQPEIFDGLIDEFRIYSRALSQAEIQTEMNTPLGGGPSPSAQHNYTIKSCYGGTNVNNSCTTDSDCGGGTCLAPVVAGWSLDEASGIRSATWGSCGSDCDLTDNNGVGQDTTNKMEGSGAGDFVNANNEYLSCTDAICNELDLASNYTMGCWARPTLDDTDRTLISKWHSKIAGVLLFFVLQ